MRGLESDLIRGIRKWDLVALTLNGVIGAGVFGMPSRAYALSGTYSVLAILVAALIASLRVLCFAEVGSRYAQTGGTYFYARRAFGSAVSFEVGLLDWFTLSSSAAAVVSVLPDYLAYFWPTVAAGSWRTTVIASVVLGLTAINVVGVRRAAVVANAFAFGKLVPLVAFVCVGLFAVNPDSFTLANAPSPVDFSRSSLLLLFVFGGFGSTVIVAGETRDPQGNIPFALLTAVSALTVLYVLIQIVCIGTLPGLADSTRPLADASARFFGPAGPKLMLFAALVAVIGSVHGLMLAAPRIPFAMATQGHLPERLADVHARFHTPHVAIVMTAGLVLVVALSGTFAHAVTISTIARLLSMTSTCLSLPVLRLKASEPPARFVVPGGWFVSMAAIALCSWLLVASPWRDVGAVLIAAAAGLVIYYFTAGRRHQAPTAPPSDRWRSRRRA